jgi:hypothetical protein
MHNYLTRAASPKGRVGVQTRTGTGGRPPLAGEQEDNRSDAWPGHSDRTWQGGVRRRQRWG